MKNKNFSILLIAAFLAFSAISCGTNETGSEPYNVSYEGALKNMMHKGDISAKVDLSDYSNIGHLYALGAIENLKGEVQIFDSKPFNSYVYNDSLFFDASFSRKATLLVYASVDNWDSLTIPRKVTNIRQLEKFIEQTAKAKQINTKRPFPFLIKGEAASLDWHVIDWAEGDTEHSHHKHITSGLNGTVTNSQVEILGFHSNAHHAIFTHHDTNVHMHFKDGSESVAGHVDDFLPGSGMTLYLPKNN